MPASLVVAGKGLSKVASGSSIVYRKWVKARHSLPPGALVELRDPQGRPRACGLWEPLGPVAVRVVLHSACPWSDAGEAVRDLISEAFQARKRAGLVEEGSYRLVNSDGDYLSGLIVDVFAGEVAVLQSSSAAIDALITGIVDAIVEVSGVEAVYEKSTQRSRRDIGLEPRRRWLRGRKPRVIVEEGQARFIVDVVEGQKTGFYLDQRPNRLEFARMTAEGDRVLDVFAYTGGFGIHAALAGAREVVFLEEDPRAASILRANLELNGVRRYRIVNESIWRAEGVPKGAYTLVAVDPPAFIQSGAPEAVEKGVRAYRAAYAWALERAAEEAVMYLSSCSYFLTRDLFLSTVNEVMTRAGARYRLLGSLRGAGPDHVFRGEEYLDYLKGAFIHVVRR